jgi:transposase-like protein
MYPEPKQRDLSETEKAQIRERIKKGDDDIYELAREFGCSSSQIAGVKAALHR